MGLIQKSEVIRPFQVPKLRRNYRVVSQEVASRLEAKANTVEEYDTSTDFSSISVIPPQSSSIQSSCESIAVVRYANTRSQKVKFQEDQVLKQSRRVYDNDNGNDYDNNIDVGVTHAEAEGSGERSICGKSVQLVAHAYQNSEYRHFLQTIAQELEIDTECLSNDKIIREVHCLKQLLRAAQMQVAESDTKEQFLQDKLCAQQMENSELCKQVEKSKGEANIVAKELHECQNVVNKLEMLMSEKQEKEIEKDKEIQTLQSKLELLRTTEKELVAEKQCLQDEKLACNKKLVESERELEVVKKENQSIYKELKDSKDSLETITNTLGLLQTEQKVFLQQNTDLADSAVKEIKKLEKKIAITKSKYIKKMKAAENESTKIIHHLYIETQLLRKIIDLHIDKKSTSLVGAELTSPIEEIKHELEKKLDCSLKTDSNFWYLCLLYENRYLDALKESKEFRDSNKINRTVLESLLKLSLLFFEKLIPSQEKVSYFNLVVKELLNRSVLKNSDLNFTQKLANTYEYLLSEVSKKMAEEEKRNIPNL